MTSRGPLQTLALFAARTGLGLLGLTMAVVGGWGVLAMAIAGPGGETTQSALAAGFGLLTLGALGTLWVRTWRWRAVAIYVLATGALFAWWQTLTPSNDRDWQEDVAVLPYATLDGDAVTVHAIRNFDYRSETDYTPAYYDRRFELSKLSGVDLIAVYWMGPAIAHIFVSFSFSDGEHLAISIETRKEKGEGYSTLKGFFRQYETVYVVADERDVVRLRTNYRKDPPEQVFIYRLQGPLANGRQLFLNYMEEINALKQRPKFYNTLTTNCTTSIWQHARHNPGHPQFSWKMLASGYLPEYLYDIGRIDSTLPFPEVQRLAHVNERAQAADAAANFSQRIREPLGLASMTPPVAARNPSAAPPAAVAVRLTRDLP